MPNVLTIEHLQSLQDRIAKGERDLGMIGEINAVLDELKEKLKPYVPPSRRTSTK